MPILLLFLLTFILPLAAAGVGNAVNCPEQLKLGTCQLLGPTDFYLAFDSTGDKSAFFRPFASSIFRTLRKLNFNNSDGHRLSIFEATANKAHLFVDVCKQQRANLSLLNLTAWLPDLRADDEAKTGLFEKLDSQMAACRRKVNFQSIALVFIHGYSPDRQADDFLNDWRASKVRSIQIYVIYGGEPYKKGNIYEKWLQNNSIHGCYYYYSSPVEKSKIDEEAAAQLINCICYKSEDCHTDTTTEKKLSKCSFAVENKTMVENRTTVEVVQCAAKFGGTIFFKPSQKLRPAARPCYHTKICNKSDVQECTDDCELKKWTQWSPCADATIYYRKRQRQPNKESLGQFSNKLCPEWQEEPCPTTAAPTTTVMAHIIDDVSQPAYKYLDNIYVFIVLACVATALLVIFVLICILVHKKRGTSTTVTTVVVVPKSSIVKGKNVTPSTSAASQTQRSAADESLALVGTDDPPTGLKSRTARSRSQRKVSLPTRSEKSLKRRSNNATTSSRKKIQMKSTRSRKQSGDRSMADVNRSRKTPRKHIKDYIKFTPRVKK